MKIAILAALLGLTQGSDLEWGYIKEENGKTWKDIKGAEGCGKANQSPIDLPGDVSGIPNLFGNADQFKKDYKNQNMVKAEWNGHTSQVTLNKDEESFFESNIAQSRYSSTTKKFNAIQFHFHAPSEHTIDGKQHDLEMHTVHLPQKESDDEETTFYAAALGIFFSVNKFTAELSWAQQKVIDNFFDGIKWKHFSYKDRKENEYIADSIIYGDLIKMVDTNKRYIYKGSVTTPPCATMVYWNVLSTVYPVSKRHLDEFKTVLNKVEGLREVGNFRVTFPPVEEHDLIYYDGPMRQTNPFKAFGGPGRVASMAERIGNRRLVAFAGVLGALLCISILVVCGLGFMVTAERKKNADNSSDPDKNQTELAAAPKTQD